MNPVNQVKRADASALGVNIFTTNTNTNTGGGNFFATHSQICSRPGCQKLSVPCKFWDNSYCSDECAVKHAKYDFLYLKCLKSSVYSFILLILNKFYNYIILFFNSHFRIIFEHWLTNRKSPTKW